MEIYRKNKLSWFIAFCFISLPALTIQAGSLFTLSELVTPGGVEIPAIVNVLGSEELNDINDVKETFRTANGILNQANVQFNVKWINSGITEIGDGDGKLSENEFNEALYRGVFELSGLSLGQDDPNNPDPGSIRWNRQPGLGKGINFYIADDVWVEQPERVFWHDIFYPVVFLESSLPPEQLGRILAQNFGLTAGLSPSTDPANLLNFDGQGTEIKEDQINWFLGLGRQVGHVRSPLAEGHSQEIQTDLRFRWSGALFESEGFTLRGDFHDDVRIEDSSGTQTGSSPVDLEAFIAKSGTIGASDFERSLILKYYFGVDELPPDIYMDTYLRVHAGHKHDNNFEDDPIGYPWETFDAVIGTGLTSDGSFVGVSNLLGDGLFEQLIGINPEVSADLSRTKVKVEIPLSRLQPHLPESVLECLNDNWGLELFVQVNTFNFDISGDFEFQDDYIDNVKLAPNPKLVPQIKAEYRLDGIDTASLSLGWDVSTWIIDEDPNGFNFNSIQEILGQPPSGVLAGRTIVPWLNFNTEANTDAFNSANGFPNQQYPGIDLSGNPNLTFVTEANSIMHIPTGLNIFGLQGKDSGILKIGPEKAGSFFSRNLNGRRDLDNGFDSSVNSSPPFKKGKSDNHLNILQRGDSAIEFKESGFYLVTARWLSHIRTESGNEPIEPNDPNGFFQASMELRHVLPDGTNALLGDVSNGSFTAYVPPEDLDIPDEPDVPDQPDGTGGYFEGFEAGTINRSLWTFDGDADWFASTEQAHTGSYSAQSGDIGDNETSSMSYFGIYPAAGEISFWIKVSTEEGFDILSFSLNGEVLGEWSGEQDWQHVVFPSRRGPNTFGWTLSRDSSSGSGEDSVWIDGVQLPPEE